MKSILSLCFVVTVSCLFGTTFAWGQGVGQGHGGLPLDTSAATECTDDEVLQGDGDCVDLPTDTNAATECDVGEVLVADGTDMGVCFPLDYTWDLRFTEDSTCPCDIQSAIHAPYTWRLDTVLDCASNNTDPLFEPGRLSLRGDRSGINKDFVLIEQDADSYTVSCLLKANGSWVDPGTSVTTQTELDDCFADLLAVATAVGVNCPSLPVFVAFP